MNVSADHKQVLRELAPFDHYLLQCISIIYEPVSAAFLTKCIGLAGHYQINRVEVKTGIDHLRTAGLLNLHNQCLPEIAEYLLRKSRQEGWFADFSKLVEKEAPVSYMYGKWTTRCWRAMRQFRIGVYTGDFDKIDESGQFLAQHCQERLEIESPAVQIVANPFDALWFGSLPGSMQFFLLDQIFRHAVEQLVHFPEVLNYLEDDEALTISKVEQVPFHRMLAGYYLLQGRFDALQSLIAEHGDSFLGSGFAGTVAFLRGEGQPGIVAFEEDLERLNQYAGPEGTFFFGLTGIFCILALLARGDEGDLRTVIGATNIVLAACKGSPEELPFRFLDAYARSVENDLPDMLALSDQLKAENRSLSTLISILCLHWMGVEIPPELQQALFQLYTRAREHGFLWLAMEAAELLATIAPEQEEMQSWAEKMREQLGCRTIVHIVSPDESWKQSLQELIKVTSAARGQEQTTRLSWFVRFTDNSLLLAPREQKRNASGQWSKGRTIGLNRLAEAEGFTYLSDQDRDICAALEQNSEQTGKNSGYTFNMEKALPAIIGHPHVFLEQSPQTPVELVAGEPELVVESHGDTLFIHFIRDIGEGEVVVWQETPTRFRIVRITDEHRRVAEITGRDGLRVPVEASGQVLDAIGNIASFMTVHSSIDVGREGQDVTLVTADPTPHIHIIPYGSGFRLEMFVQPFSHAGPYLKPGVGETNIMAEVKGRRLQTKRNLLLEEEKAREVEESCPMLDLAIDLEQENEREWHLLDPEECLQAPLEIEEIRDRVVLEWPEGEKIAVRRQTGVNQLNLNIRTSQQDWFSLSGHLQVDQDEVIELKSLLEQVKKSHSRFIPMGDGQFLALTQEFRNRLEELILFGEEGRAENEIYVHPLAAPALEELTRQARTTVDDGWRQRLQAINEAQDFVPEVPSTLQAELRDYQVEGFVWMVRLARLGIGACLADDMGLGKTLQSLAVILYFAGKGPTLVVAPTSVCMNWEQEVNRFAPTLKMHMLGSLDREEVIQGLGKYDLLVTSYTLLQQEVELLEQVDWQCIALDEAQAIKNAATKRSKAAKRLKAKFKLITTGTPIENHLGELWNLFSFINPGLLGTYKRFNSRFGIPIEKHHDQVARRKLKKLIRPFMLRRIKSQVLEELPPRTEITLRVEMSSEEVAFYEALRQQAMENIEGNAEKTGRHLRILAEIMRLRRACCNPRLISEDIEIPSTKLRVFAEVVEELIASRHKALVFSQFTGHLALIRELLDAKEITYKYLDGTTPARERQRQVDSFQAGEGDLFLISLKAGGLGLNLTAADYVLHMDPWWNPAVEDQAADRAHRIGQKRPVTVYRLITANTIEEKIVRLHQEKRDLANSLLEGSDVGARISAEELLELIRGA